jgi:hypothetical protein
VATRLAERRNRRQSGRQATTAALPVLLIPAAVLLLYHGAFRCFFILDDFAWLSLSRFDSFREFARCLFRFNGAGTYRPLSQETFFWLGQRLFGLNSPGFHGIALAAHCLAALLLYFLLRHFSGRLPAFTGALLYAVHGAHVTSLYWISAFPEPLAMVFGLASILLFIRFDREGDRRSYFLSLAAMVLGLMSKESVLTLPVILAAYCLLIARKKIVWTLPYFAFSGAAVLMRLAGRVSLAPYNLDVGADTVNNLIAYLSWMAGFTESFLRSRLPWGVTASYPWIAAVFLAALIVLLLLSRRRRVALFSLCWMGIALQPVLYFSDHSFAYYLAPALAGFSLLIASALPAPHGLWDWKRWLPSVAMMFAGLAVAWGTIRPEGEWWIERAAARRVLLEKLGSVNRRVPEEGKAYILGLRPADFESLENMTVFSAWRLPRDKFHFLLPELDRDLPEQLERLVQGGGIGRAYAFEFSADGIVDRTAEFRADPERLLPSEPVRFLVMPEVRLEVSPAVVVRGSNTLVIRTLHFDAPAIDILYAIDGQLFPPLLGWQLDRRRTASVFVGRSTPAGEYDFRAIRRSGAGPYPWVAIDARVTVH